MKMKWSDINTVLTNDFSVQNILASASEVASNCVCNGFRKVILRSDFFFKLCELCFVGHQHEGKAWVW